VWPLTGVDTASIGKPYGWKVLQPVMVTVFVTAGGGGEGGGEGGGGGGDGGSHCTRTSPQLQLPPPKFIAQLPPLLQLHTPLRVESKKWLSRVTPKTPLAGVCVCKLGSQVPPEPH
jgi:hypothetical protein